MRWVPAGGSAVSPGAPGPQAVFAALALRAGHLVSADQLVDDLYDDEPPVTARRVIVNYVHRLRSRIDAAEPSAASGSAATGSAATGSAATGRPGAARAVRAEAARAESVIESVAGGYRLRIPSEAVDALRFCELVEQARPAIAGGAPETAVTMLEEALGLWQGSTLAGVPGPYADAQRRALEEQRATATECHLELMLQCGRHMAAIPGVLAALEIHPYRERLYITLMLALYRSGRSAEALAAYDRARTVFAGELGIDTGSELKELHAAVLAGDPVLLEVPAPAPVGTRRPDPAPGAGRGAGDTVPRQLPPPPADFVGRADENARLTGALTEGDDHAVAVVTGMGGVGKTSLALRAAHAVASHFPDGQLYAELRGADGAPTDPADVLERFLSALSVPPGRIPLRVDDRAALFRTLAFDRSMLIVLDNAAGAEQVRLLLPGAPHSAVLVTARTLASVPATLRLPLEGLSGADAFALLSRLAGQDRMEREPQSASALARACGHLPLALRVTAARLAARPSWTVEEMVSRLSDEVRLLRELRVEDLSVEAAFEVSFAQLNPEQTRAFLMLSLPHSLDWGVSSAAAVLCLPELDAETVLESLVDAALLESPAPGRFRYHDLVGVYARSKAHAELTDDERLDAVLRAVDHAAACIVNAVRATHPLGGPLTREAHPRRSRGADLSVRAEAVEWVRREVPTLAALAEQAATTGSPDAIAHGVDILALLPAFEETLPLAVAVRAATELVPAAERWCGEDVTGTAYYAAGVLHRNRASSARAEHYLTRVLDHLGDSPTLTDGVRRFLCVLFALSMLSDLHLQCGHFESARRYGLRAVSLAETTGDHGLVQRRRTVLLRIEVRDPRRRRALTRIRDECRALAAEFTGSGDHESLFAVRLAEAESYSQEGRYAHAARLYGDVLERIRVSGRIRTEAECRYRLAETLLATGDTAAALEEASQALSASLLAQENLLMARSHRVLGRALRAVGDGAAAEHFVKAAGLQYELGLDTAGDEAGHRPAPAPDPAPAPGIRFDRNPGLRLDGDPGYHFDGDPGYRPGPSAG
ncbi:AfsR/SARP family transcriptional regulator [Streptomyces roseifaciens]|uniref:AfsR/SARP family transcriptional regulator n=1 Tax=Streptomyces roseifaciens TaxID=1488406 RepID=UPI001FDF2E88|nr:BTAD domain-containing putative transcriptional regulator [Streptomyces roseifaciens]